MIRPDINVTPLIDVLLVLLIIFMIVAPKKPTDIETKIPQEPKQNADDARANPYTLVVTIGADSNLHLNNTADLGTIEEPAKLIDKLRAVFAERAQNGVYNEDLAARSDIADADKILKIVFIKAPVGMNYGRVVRVIDAVKTAGANPISLQIDGL